jgi:hypothetical protein
MCTTTLVLPSKIYLNNIKTNHKKFKINEIQNKYQKKEKRKNQQKYGPTGFKPGSCGVRGRAPFHWAR